MTDRIFFRCSNQHYASEVWVIFTGNKPPKVLYFWVVRAWGRTWSSLLARYLTNRLLKFCQIIYSSGALGEKMNSLHFKVKSQGHSEMAKWALWEAFFHLSPEYTDARRNTQPENRVPPAKT